MKRTVDQRVLGTAETTKNRTMTRTQCIHPGCFAPDLYHVGSFESHNTFRPTPSQSWCTVGLAAMLRIKAFEDLFRRLFQADVPVLQRRCCKAVHGGIANEVVLDA